jgi:hypothetical protein
MSLNLEEAIGGSFCFSNVGLGIGSSTNQLSTAATANYTLDGVYQTAKNAVATFALATPSNFVLTNIPNGSKSNFGVWLDSSGNLTVTQGPVSVVTTGTDKVAPPPNPGSRTLIGVASVYNASGSAFVPGTTAFNAAGVTTNYFNLCLLPASGF